VELLFFCFSESLLRIILKFSPLSGDKLKVHSKQIKLRIRIAKIIKRQKGQKKLT